VEFENAEDGFFDQIIWATRSGGDSDGQWGGREPLSGTDFFFCVEIKMYDPFRRLQT
jgi:hypothetical protein